MHLAAGLGHHVILKAILMAPTTNVNARTVSGVTPLMLATKRGQVSISKAFRTSVPCEQVGGTSINVHSMPHLDPDKTFVLNVK